MAKNNPISPTPQPGLPDAPIILRRCPRCRASFGTRDAGMLFCETCWAKTVAQVQAAHVEARLRRELLS